MLRPFSLLLISLLAIPFYLQSQSLQEKVTMLDQYIEQAREQWNVPGLSVAIVKDGELLLMAGYGERELGSGRKVDGKTLFAICSTTKAMTSAAMAMLVDEGKLDWDDPVTDHFPGFQLSDPYITRSVRIRDLFTHNVGLGNADLLWYAWQYEPAEIIDRVADLEMSYPLRGGYTYQNIMYAVAGTVMENVSGQTWADFLQERIFDPLEMNNTFPTLEKSMNYSNRSVAHHRVDGDIVPIPDASADPIAPAGAVWSCAEDMQKWMKFVLDSARVNGERLISQENYMEWLKPQIIVSDAGFYPTQRLTQPHWKTYALGWFQHDYMGRAVSFHTGSLQGTVAIIGVIPDEGLGVYVFGNLDHAEVRHAIMYKVFDVLGPVDPQRDWSTELIALYDKLRIDREAQSNGHYEAKEAAFSIQELEGNYTNTVLGEAIVFAKEGKLFLTTGEITAQLELESHTKYRVIYPDQPWRRNGSMQFKDDGYKVVSLEIYGQTFVRDKM